MSRTKKGLLGVLGVVTVVWLAQTFKPSGPSVTGPPRVTVTTSSPPEVLLPFIDTGQRQIAPGLIRLYSGLLDQLDDRCVQDRTMISDQSVRATQIIEQEARPKVSNESFLKEWLEAVRGLPLDPHRDCTPIAAALMAAIG